MRKLLLCFLVIIFTLNEYTNSQKICLYPSKAPIDKCSICSNDLYIPNIEKNFSLNTLGNCTERNKQVLNQSYYVS